jgi:hypothetical protein
MSINPRLRRRLAVAEVFQPEGAGLLDEVEVLLRRFVVFPSDEAAIATVLWAAHTHFMDKWDTTPRIAFLSPEPASGKSRVLEILELLVPRPALAVNMSAAALFRLVGSEEGLPTILFDEIDTVFGPKAKEHEDVRGLLNAGYRRGSYTYRAKSGIAGVVTEKIEAYSAVALAGLGNLPDTILSRSIIIRMKRRAPNEPVEPYRRRLHARDGNALRDRLAQWADAISGQVNWPEELPPSIQDRDADIWEPLIAMADLAGGEWPARSREAAVALVATAQEDGNASLAVRLLADIRLVFGEEEQIPSIALVTALCNLDDAPWGDMRGKPLDSRRLARILASYGVKPGTIRTAFGATPKGYKREAFHDAWQRYLPPLTCPAPE